MKRIGFVGLGHMGLPMALNLCRKGFRVCVASRNAASQATILQAGGELIDSFKAMGELCDAVITVLPADKEIVDVYTSSDGILANPKEGLVCIDMTSAKGMTKRDIAQHIKNNGFNVSFIDAPISGGVKGAQQGTLTIMVGCSDSEFDIVQPILATMGTNIIHTGDVGTGSDIKMLNQMLNAANTAIAAEVLCLSRKLEIKDDVLFQVINQSSGSSFVFQKNVPKFMMTGIHIPGFKLKLMEKDVSLFVESAQAKHVFAPISSLVFNLYKAADNQGMGELNYTAIHKWFDENQSK